MKRILILGCGWVGEFAANKWKRRGFEVWASTTNTDKQMRLQESGLSSFMIDFDKEYTTELDFPEYFDAILISVPASKKNTVEEIRNRFHHVRRFTEQLRYSKLIFLSSIGIYPNESKSISEFTYTESMLDPRLLQAEQIMLSLSNSYVYRLGGLFGLNRIFAKYFAAEVMTTGDELANFIHIDDVFGMIDAGFTYSLRERIYNAVAPLHPTKREVVIASATRYGLELPSEFLASSHFQKKVSGSLLQNDLHYTFKYPSPLDF